MKYYHYYQKKNKYKYLFQVVFVSATIPPYTEKFANKILENPVFIKIGDDKNEINDVIEQNVYWVEEKSKKKVLFDILNNPQKFIKPSVIFVDNKYKIYNS